MKAKGYLLQYRKLDRVIRNKEIEKQQWKDLATSITVNTDGERVQSSGRKDGMANAVAKYVDLEIEIDKLINSCIKLKMEITSTLEQLNADDYELLHKVYIQGMELKLASYSMGRSESWGSTTHGRALQRLDRILSEREVNEKL